MTKLTKHVPIKHVLWTFACVSGAVVCILLLGAGPRWTARGITDFMALHAGAKLCFTDHQYDIARVLATESQATGFGSEDRLFNRLPFVGLFVWPLAQLPYRAASAVWEMLCLAAIVGFVALWPASRRHVVLASCWFLPVWFALAMGQDALFLLLWLDIGLLAISKSRPFLAGMVLSLCLAKFHLFLLLPLWMVKNRLWRVGSGFVIGGIALLAACFAAGGRFWWLHYYKFLRNPITNPYPEQMPNLHGVLARLPHALPAEVISGILIVVAAWFAIRKLDAFSGLAPVLIAGLVIAPHGYVADCILLLPALLMLISGEQSLLLKWAALLLLSPEPYILLILGHNWVLLLPLVGVLIALAFGRRCSETATPPQFALYPAAAAHSPA